MAIDKVGWVPGDRREPEKNPSDLSIANPRDVTFLFSPEPGHAEDGLP